MDLKNIVDGNRLVFQSEPTNYHITDMTCLPDIFGSMVCPSRFEENSENAADGSGFF